MALAVREPALAVREPTRADTHSATTRYLAACSTLRRRARSASRSRRSWARASACRLPSRSAFARTASQDLTWPRFQTWKARSGTPAQRRLTRAGVLSGSGRSVGSLWNHLGRRDARALRLAASLLTVCDYRGRRYDPILRFMRAGMYTNSRARPRARSCPGPAGSRACAAASPSRRGRRPRAC